GTSEAVKDADRSVFNGSAVLYGKTTLDIMNATFNGDIGTVAKLAMRQPFVLFKGLTFQKLCLPGAFRPGDHHN
ncbi:hypothetical protein, partial [Escherichia coli]|uniref:hypothetical protein n=1 Tax=Escherichia coli TaxID=562 RepID=UPI0021B426E2